MPARCRNLRLLWWIATAACGAPAGGAPDAGAPIDAAPADAALPYTAELLATRPYRFAERATTVTTYRIHRPDGGRTYAAWVPSDRTGPRPALVVTMPYAATPWSGEPLDARWAGYAPEADGLYLDRDGPGAPGAETIVLERSTADELGPAALAQLLNDTGTLLVFGRFYAGGSVRDDVADMAAGMWLAAELPAIDPDRLGIWGGSWGGFEALFAARGADARARPRVVAAMYPPSDFAAWAGHATSRTGRALSFLHPYLRRLYAATGGAPGAAGADYAGLRVDDLCAALPADTLTLHDEADNLVPVGQSQALVARCHATALYWPRLAPVDPAAISHGPITDPPKPEAVTTYALAYAQLRLAPPAQPYVIVLASSASLRAHLAAVAAAQAAGRAVADVAPRLRELCDTKLYALVDCPTGGCPTEPGAQLVARLVNERWGTTYTTATIAAALAGGLPPPPPAAIAPARPR